MNNEKQYWAESNENHNWLLCEDPSSESKFWIIGTTDDLFLGVKGQDGHDWPEYFLLHDGHVILAVDQYTGTDKVAPKAGVRGHSLSSTHHWGTLGKNDYHFNTMKADTFKYVPYTFMFLNKHLSLLQRIFRFYL